MKNKMKALLLSLLIIISMISNVFAYTQEIGKATPYYAHPVTGAIEDPGNGTNGKGVGKNRRLQPAHVAVERLGANL